MHLEREILHHVFDRGILLDRVDGGRVSQHHIEPLQSVLVDTDQIAVVIRGQLLRKPVYVTDRLAKFDDVSRAAEGVRQDSRSH